LRGSRV